MANPAVADSDVEALEKLREAHKKLRKEVGKIIIGQEAVLDLLLMAIFCRSHALLMGVPGLAKTLMVSTLAMPSRIRAMGTCRRANIVQSSR